MQTQQISNVCLPACLPARSLACPPLLVIISLSTLLFLYLVVSHSQFDTHIFHVYNRVLYSFNIYTWRMVLTSQYDQFFLLPSTLYSLIKIECKNIVFFFLFFVVVAKRYNYHCCNIYTKIAQNCRKKLEMNNLLIFNCWLATLSPIYLCLFQKLNQCAKWYAMHLTAGKV